MSAIKTKLLLVIMVAIYSLSCSADGLNLLGENKVFVFVAGGGTKLDVNSFLAPGSTLTKGALDETGKELELGVGYHYSKDYFITLAAQKSMLDILDVNNIYGSINYKLPIKNAQPYIGVLLGYSQLDWSKRPHVMLFNEDLTSDGYMYGLQLGINKEIRKKASLFIKYQFIKYDHKIEILNNTSNIEHKSGQNVLIGMRYLF